MDRYCPTPLGKIEGIMNKKEKFLMFVYLGAIASDVADRSQDAPRIANYASRIQEKAIPPNPVNAAQVYVAYMRGRTEPFQWMVGARKCERNRENAPRPGVRRAH